MRAMWKGTVAFGLVAIPINLYAATENKGVQLRQVHEADGGRIQYKRWCSVEDAEVPYAEIAKGYELDDGRMVVLTDAELSSLPLPSQKTIDVLEFVPLAAIDPLFFDKAYYLEPQKSAVKPYVLLRDALHKSGHVAIAKVALRQREVLAVLRVHNDVLTMSTMLWPDEVRTPDFSFLQEDAPQVREQELTMAGQLIDSLAEPVFEPDRYQDSYRQALENLIEAKVEGEEVTTPPGVEQTAEVVDLISALQASVKAAGRTKPAAKRATVRKDTAEKKPSAKRRPTRSA
ncbi:Ku protein [Kutzneria sp. 744]|uniref:non-homologous end joining protein Ku n=1 Tax=Kutzneria sp. (strain 744) TaxID=345341 RepID=UPI0003EECE58|nr:Ku protein [Kutzneria sp. 744]EWM11285.1 DNA end-binding protein Ku [Kutzneria sp. 744]